MKTREAYSYKAGEIVDRDTIYSHMGLAGGDWWESIDGDELSEKIEITKSVKIVITATVTSRTEGK